MAEHDGAAPWSPSKDDSAENVDENNEKHQPFFSMCAPLRPVSHSNSWEGVCAPAASEPVSWESKLWSPNTEDDFDVPDKESNKQPEPLGTEKPDSNQQSEWDLWPAETKQQLMPLDGGQPNCKMDTAPCDVEAKQFSLSLSYTMQPKSVGAGLRNMGNSCFLNATLQCISHTVPLILKLRSIDHSTPCSFDKYGFCSFCSLKEHVDESIQRSGSVIMPAKFRDNLRSILSS